MAASTIRSQPSPPPGRPSRLSREAHRIWTILCLAVERFLRIDGEQRAGAFAFNAFFSLFPLVVLSVSIASAFVDRDRATKEIIAHMETYVPVSGEMQSHILNTIDGVVKSRGQAGAVAFLILIWVGIQSFTSLISATNRAWETQVSKWWRLPLKSAVQIGITASAVLVGMAVLMLMHFARGWLLPAINIHSWVYGLGSFIVPLVLVFFSLSLFYRLAPSGSKQFAQVWVAALCATVLLQVTESLFLIYLKNFATSNAVYGVFGGFTAFLLCIYLFGCIVIFGACLCAVQADEHSLRADAIVAA